MLPGAVPPPRKQENVVEATFDKPASAKTLETSGKVKLFLKYIKIEFQKYPTSYLLG